MDVSPDQDQIIRDIKRLIIASGISPDKVVNCTAGRGVIIAFLMGRLTVNEFCDAMHNLGIFNPDLRHSKPDRSAQ